MHPTISEVANLTQFTSTRRLFVGIGASSAFLFSPWWRSASAQDMAAGHGMPNASFTLRTGVAGGKMVYIGKGGAIDGLINPDLIVHEGDIVQITLINGEGAEH